MEPRVTIRLKEYNRLLKAEESVKSGKKITIVDFVYSGGVKSITSYYTESKIIEDLKPQYFALNLQ